MDKIAELRQELAGVKEEVRSLLNENKVEDAETKMEEVRALEKKIKLQEELEAEEKRELEEKLEVRNMETKTQKDVDVRSLFTKVVKGKATQEERALLNSANGEDGGYLVPTEIKTEINELKRQYKSAKDLVDVIPTSTKSGSFVIENLSSLTELVNFDDDNDADLATQQPKFSNVEYSIKNYGAITPISNTLLQDETGALLTYINRYFAKKAVRTENVKIFDVLKSGKTAKAVADVKALKKLVNTELDPAIKDNAVIITNQDGFNFFDELEDEKGRPMLQPDPTNTTQYRLLGLEVHVFSNAELKTTGTTTKKAPVFIGDMEEAVKFFDRGVYEVALSKEAGFTKNQTVARVIERFDVAKADADAYVYAEVTVNGQ